MKPLMGLSEVVERYDLFLLDQFGVLHDGKSVYAQAVRTLRSLRQAAKTVFIISNSGKRAEANMRRMDAMGLERDLYDSMVTSGEVTWRLLEKGDGGFPSMRGRRCLLISSGDDGLDLGEIGVTRVNDARDADLVLIAGGEGNRYSEAYYRDLLRPAAERELACLCSNPDMISLSGDDRHFGPGRIAEIYRELGGDVRYIGKPYPEIYTSVFDMADALDRSRTLCIGDSIEHDIAGATAAGLDSVLITSGILRGASLQELSALSREHAATPNFLMESLVW